MSLHSLLERVGLLKKREKEEEEARYRIVLEEVSPTDYLNHLKEKRDKISGIMKFSDIHNLLQESSVKEKEKKELSKMEG